MSQSRYDANLIYVAQLPYVWLGNNANTWWGSVVAAFGMLPAMGLIYLVNLFQQYGFEGP
jgi:hypothetical protein